MNIEIIKNFISNTVFKSKKLDHGILQALAITAGIEDHNARNAYQAIRDIAENTPDEVYNNLLPLNVKPGKKAAADVLFDFIADAKEMRPALHGVYSDKERGLYCATDSRFMAIAPIPENVQNTLGKSIIKDKNGCEITAVYPDYFRIIPQDCRNSVKLDGVYLYAGFVGSLCNFNACFFDNPNKTPVNIDGVEFQPDLLFNALQAFCKCGCISVTMEYNTPEYPVKFTAANGLQVVAMPLHRKNNGGFSFPVHARVNVLTDDAQLHNFSLDHRKIFAGGNEFFGTCKNPLYGVKFSISQDEIEKLDENIKRHYHDIISRIAAGAVYRAYDAKTKNLDGMNISVYIKESDYTVASEHTAFEHKYFVDKVKSIKSPDDCKSALPELIFWMHRINEYVISLKNSGYKSDYSGSIATFNIEYYEKAIFAACQKNIADEKITLEYAQGLFYGGQERYNAIAELVKNANAESEKREKEMQAAIPADSGIYMKQVTGSDGNIELYYQHEKCGCNLYRTIEELLTHKRQIEKRAQEEREEREEKERKKAEFERLQAERTNLNGYEKELSGIKRDRVINYLNRITRYFNSDIRGKKLKEIIENQIHLGYIPQKRLDDRGRDNYYFCKSIGDGCSMTYGIDSKIEYDYAVYLYENNIIKPDNASPISEDSEKTQNNAVTSDIEQDAVNHTLERTNTAGTPENNKKQDAEPDNLPYWNKAKELCNVSSGTLANLLNCDKYSVIARVKYEWREYIASNGTTADNWQKCWQEFQQSEEYNYLALIHGLPLPPPDECKPDISGSSGSSGSSGNDRPDNASEIISNADAELPPDDTMPFNACAQAYEHTDCHCKPSMQASSYMRMHPGKHTDCPPDKSNVAASCMRAGIHTYQHRQCNGIASIAVPAAVPDG
jgi:hypothetical protein